MSEYRFKTIHKATEGIFKDRGSKFIGYVFPIDSVEDFKSFMHKVKEEHSSARHFCYAYRLGVNGEEYRANDDGEPSGSAGKPILNQLLSAEITNVGAIVVRYFGGTKLGVSGLINAYKSGVVEALVENEIIERDLQLKIKLQFDYTIMSDVMNYLKRHDIHVLEQKFENDGEILVSVNYEDKQIYLEGFAQIDNLKITEITS